MTTSLPDTMPSRAVPGLPLGRRLRYYVEAAGFFLVIGFFRLFDIDRASAIGGWIGRRLVAPTRASRRAQRNLRLAYPDKSESELREILIAMWDNLGRVLAEYPHLMRIRWDGPDARVETSGIEHLEAAKASGKGIIIVTGHFANWEVMPFVGRHYGLAGGMIVRPTNNPSVNRWLDTVRSHNGLERIAKGPQGTRRAFSILRRGGEVLGILVDQRASEGIPVPFFGREAFTTPAPAALALKLGAVLLPVSNARVGGGARFRVRVHPIIEPEITGDSDRDLVALTSRLTQFIEERVRERPGEWLWIHKRWVDENAPLRKRAQALSDARATDSG